MMASTCGDAERFETWRTCAATVGRGLFLAWMLTGLIPSSTLHAGAGDEGMLLALRLASHLGFIACLVLPPLLWRRLDEARVRRRTLAAAGALGTAGCLLYALVAFGVVPRAVQFAAIACTVAAVPLAGPLWGELFCRLRPWDATWTTLAGLAVAALDLLAVTLLPAVLAAAVLAGTPTASCALLALARRGLVPRPCVDPAPFGEGMQPSPRLLAGVFLAMAASGVAMGNSEFTYAIDVVSFAVSSLLSVPVVLLAVRHDDRADLAHAGQALVGAMALGLAASAVSALAGASLQLALVCHQCLGVLAWLSLLGVARETSVNPYYVMGLGLLFVNAGSAAGSVAGMLASRVPEVVAPVALCLLVAAMWCLCTAERPRVVHVDPDVVFERKVSAFSERFGLTPRETEALSLWVSGRQMGAVAEAMGVAKNTAKTHVLHVYQKSGTSNKAELMRAFDEVDEQPRA